MTEGNGKPPRSSEDKGKGWLEGDVTDAQIHVLWQDGMGVLRADESKRPGTNRGGLAVPFMHPRTVRYPEDLVKIVRARHYHYPGPHQGNPRVVGLSARRKGLELQSTAHLGGPARLRGKRLSRTGKTLYIDNIM